ncbi:MAG: hypothetical protein IPK82_22020 [Polyangiaceae bacterium]|nr:hypothetical protein [Polyangiaceae bacterium]
MEASVRINPDGSAKVLPTCRARTFFDSAHRGARFGLFLRDFLCDAHLRGEAAALSTDRSTTLW